MALIPQLSLQTRGIEVQQPDLLRTLLGGAQLREAQDQSALRTLQMRQLGQDLRERQALTAPGGPVDRYKQLLGGGPSLASQQGTPMSPEQVPALNPQAVGSPLQQSGSPPLPGAQTQARQAPVARQLQQEDIYRELALTRTGQPIAKILMELDQHQLERRKTTAALQKDELEGQLKASQAMAEMFSSVQDAPEAERPALYAEARAVMERLVPHAAAAMPATYDPRVVGLFGTMAVSAKEKATQALTLMERKTAIANTKLREREHTFNVKKTGTQQDIDQFRAETDAIQAETAQKRLGEVEYQKVGDDVLAMPKYGTPGQGAPQGTRLGPTPESRQPLREAAAKRLKDAYEAADAGQKVQDTLDEVDRLIDEGVYEQSPTLLAALETYKRTGTVLPSYDDATLARTQRLREMGAALTLSQGSLGNQVSEGDRRTYEQAMGNFQQGRTKQAMQESLLSMRTIADKAMRNANEVSRKIEAGELTPAYQPRPGAGKTVGEGAIQATMDEMAARGDPKTRAQVIEEFKKQGYRVVK